MDPDLDLRIAAVAARQCSMFSRRQALGVGATDSAIRHRVRRGRWNSPHPGVYGILGAAPGYGPALWAAVLAVGDTAVVSHQSAAALHRMLGFPEVPLVVTAGRGTHHRVAGTTVHQIGDLLEHHVTISRELRLPVTTPARTLVDLAGVTSPARLAAVYDELLAARPRFALDVAATLVEVSRRGKPGITVLSRLMDSRGPGRTMRISTLERHFLELIRRFGLPEPQLQFPFPGRMGLDGCVDGAYPEARLITEVDGRRWHSRVRDMARDRERDAQAACAGWQTLRFLYEHVVGAPDQVACTVRETLLVRTRAAA